VLSAVASASASRSQSLYIVRPAILLHRYHNDFFNCKNVDQKEIEAGVNEEAKKLDRYVPRDSMNSRGRPSGLRICQLTGLGCGRAAQVEGHLGQVCDTDQR
jgi:hypothetical protein